MANNFSADANCKALWRFESGALTTDSKGSNALTDINTVAENTVNYKEGVCSADFERDNTEAFKIADASLDAGFPLKSGDTNKKISVCAWLRPEEVTLEKQYFSKTVWTTGGRSFILTLYSAHIEMLIGYNSGNSYEIKAHATDLSVGTWYHVTGTYDNADKSYTIRVRDTDGNVVGTDLTGTATLDANGISITSSVLTLGSIALNADATSRLNHYDGLVDEIVVFDDIITAAEATQIAQGTYGPVIAVPRYGFTSFSHGNFGII